MRRITLKYARPGMKLGLPVYDNFGIEVLNGNVTLDDRSLSLLVKNGIREILIEDWRVDDIIVAPMFSPKHEGALASGFRHLLTGIAAQRHITDSDLELSVSSTYQMANKLSRDILGEINLSCWVSQAEYVYLQPVNANMLAMALGRKLGMSTKDLMTLGMAALLKDIGYVQESPKILTDPSQLTKLESGAVRKHPQDGYNLLQQASAAKGEITSAVLQHHEYWNGAGYPGGLKGTQISHFAQVVSIADAFADLLAEYPGRSRFMPHEVIEFIMANSGEQFNPELVEFFVRHIPSYSNGLTVKLNTGEVGIVSNPNLGFVARPVVRICWEPQKGMLKEPYDVDLSLSASQHKLVVKVLDYD